MNLKKFSLPSIRLSRLKLSKNQLLVAAKEAYKKRGVYHVLYHGIMIIYAFLYYKLLIYLKPPGVFYFQGQTYHYFFHWYNRTWKNERAVEVPIILKKVQSYRGKRILEVGNVLSHYVSFQHDILDKYEKVDGVINEDVVDFSPQKKYDLIVSISTLEHVGWDDRPREPAKILRALDNLKSLLADGGEIIVTLPLGYNTEMDSLLAEGRIGFSHKYHLKRISGREWIEVGRWDKKRGDTNYSFASHASNALVIGVIENKRGNE